MIEIQDREIRGLSVKIVLAGILGIVSMVSSAVILYFSIINHSDTNKTELLDAIREVRHKQELYDIKQDNISVRVSNLENKK